MEETKSETRTASPRKDAIETLSKLVNVFYDYQDLRIRTSNRLARKADGEDQNMDTPNLPEKEMAIVESVLTESKDLEKKIENAIKREVKKFPVYTEFLSKVRGCGPMMSAVLIASIDIEKAVNASKIIQYAGLNPGMVRGRKKDADGNIILTDDMVRGDRPTKGYLIPYNKKLKCKVMGVLASCFIKANSQYKVYYDNMKQRLSNSNNQVGGKEEGKKWKDESKGHIAMAAQRYMMKMFLCDLYAAWRHVEGLPVRCRYEEEYLGHKTTMTPLLQEIMKEKEKE